MIEMEVFKQDLTAVRNMIAEAGESLHVDHLREQLVEYQEDMGSNGFWDDTERATRISAKANSTENRIKHYESLINRADEIEIMMELAEEEDDESMAEDIKKEFASLKEDLESLRLQTLLTGEYDDCNCILTLHAGAGGTEAQDWTQMLYRMYTRFCERMGFAVKELDYLDGDEAGIKSVSFEVTGDYAYGYLKAERGVHRLVRISPFDANARRHTSFASLDVAPIIVDNSEIEIRNEDLRIDTYRAGGAGGQYVNKTESAVRMTHIPTGIVAQCQDEKSQLKNREKCLRVLRARILEKAQEEQRAATAEDRKSQVGTGDRSERIRTYNYPQGRVTDHRIGLTLHKLDSIVNGDMDELLDALITAKQSEQLRQVK